MMFALVVGYSNFYAQQTASVRLSACIIPAPVRNAWRRRRSGSRSVVREAWRKRSGRVSPTDFDVLLHNSGRFEAYDLDGTINKEKEEKKPTGDSDTDSVSSTASTASMRSSPPLSLTMNSSESDGDDEVDVDFGRPAGVHNFQRIETPLTKRGKNVKMYNFDARLDRHVGSLNPGTRGLEILRGMEEAEAKSEVAKLEERRRLDTKFDLLSILGDHYARYTDLGRQGLWVAFAWHVVMNKSLLEGLSGAELHEIALFIQERVTNEEWRAFHA